MHKYIHPDITELVIPGENCRYSKLLELFGVYMQTTIICAGSDGDVSTFEIFLTKASWKHTFCISYAMLEQLPEDIRKYTMDQEIIKGIGLICEKVINETQF